MKVFFILLLLTFTVNSFAAELPIYSEVKFKQLTKAEQQKYIKRVQLIYINFEKYVNSQKSNKYSRLIELINPIAHANNKKICLVGGIEITKKNGRCNYKKGYECKVNGKVKPNTFKCGLIFGKKCISTKKWGGRLSLGCYKDSKVSLKHYRQFKDQISNQYERLCIDQVVSKIGCQYLIKQFKHLVNKELDDEEKGPKLSALTKLLLEKSSYCKANSSQVKKTKAIFKNTGCKSLSKPLGVFGYGGVLSTKEQSIDELSKNEVLINIFGLSYREAEYLFCNPNFSLEQKVSNIRKLHTEAIQQANSTDANRVRNLKKVQNRYLDIDAPVWLNDYHSDEEFHLPMTAEIVVKDYNDFYNCALSTLKKTNKSCQETVYTNENIQKQIVKNSANDQKIVLPLRVKFFKKRRTYTPFLIGKNKTYYYDGKAIKTAIISTLKEYTNLKCDAVIAPNKDTKFKTGSN